MTVDDMLDDILKREGGFVNHKADRGGPTNFGITQATYSAWLGRSASVDDVRNMPEADARLIYELNYLRKPRIDHLPAELQPAVFDAAVNHGPLRAIRFVQRACRYTGADLFEDGVCGPQTIKAVRETAAWIGLRAFKAILWLERRSFYQDLVLRKPDQRVFLKGWMARLDEFDPTKGTAL